MTYEEWVNLTPEERHEMDLQLIEQIEEEIKQLDKELIEVAVKLTINRHGKTDAAKKELREYFKAAGWDEKHQQYANIVWQRHTGA